MVRGRTIVVGAGLSGLACAFDLVRAGLDVALFESSDRPGGVVGTREIEAFRFERGPNTVQASAADFRRLCADLGIAGRLIASSPAARERYLFDRGVLTALPCGPLGLATTPLVPLGAKLRLATEPFRRWRPPAAGAPEPDLGTFLRERLGREPTRVFAGAFVRGVYAAELDELGAQSAFPRMWNLVAEHGGFVRGLWANRHARRPELPDPKFPRSSLLSFPRGLQEVVDTLAAALGARLRLCAPVAALERDGRRWRVRLASGDIEDAARVVLALPAPAAATLLAPIAGKGAGTHARNPVPVEHLAAIRHARVTLVHLGFAAEELTSWRSGFGYLVPPADPARPAVSEPPRVLGTIFTSNLFPGRAPEGCRSVSSFYPGAAVERLNREEQVDLACRDLALALGNGRTPRPRVAHVERWNDVIPRYGPGHAERVGAVLQSVRDALPGLELAGSWVAGVSVDQVIARGRAIAREIIAAAEREGAR